MALGVVGCVCVCLCVGQLSVGTPDCKVIYYITSLVSPIQFNLAVPMRPFLLCLWALIHIHLFKLVIPR
jgi:hypothetical protein